MLRHLRRPPGERGGLEPGGAPPGHSRGPRRPKAGNWRGDRRGQGAAALFHRQRLARRRGGLHRLRHRRHLRRSGGHGGAHRHFRGLPGPGAPGGRDSELQPPLSPAGQRALSEDGLCGYVHGAGHAPGDDGVLSAHRPGSLSAAAGSLGDPGPVGDGAGGAGLAAAAPVPLRRLPRAENTADGDSLQRGAPLRPAPGGAARPVDGQHPLRVPPDEAPGGGDADPGPGGQPGPASRAGGGLLVRRGGGLRPGLRAGGL